jgi:hypothetical protein
MDNASYHCDTENKSPTSNSKKAEIQNWLRERNIAFEAKSLKPQLLEKVKLYEHFWILVGQIIL